MARSALPSTLTLARRKPPAAYLSKTCCVRGDFEQHAPRLGFLPEGAGSAETGRCVFVDVQGRSSSLTCGAVNDGGNDEAQPARVRSIGIGARRFARVERLGAGIADQLAGSALALS